MSKNMNFCNSREIYLRNMEKKLLDTATKAGLAAAKTASKKAEETRELIESLKKVVKSEPVLDKNSRNVFKK